MKPSSNRDVVPQPLVLPELSPRALHKLSQREQMRITLRAILRDTWQPLWRLTRRFDKAWYALLISGILAVGHANSAPAQAAPGISSSVSGSALTVTGTPGDDTITLTVSAGNIKINDADPDSGAATSASVSSITINAGDGNDTVDLYALRRADLGANPSATVDAGAGDDTYLLSPDIGGIATDTTGSDTLVISADGEIVFSSNRSVTINSSYTTTNPFNGFFEQAVLLGGTGDDTLNAANASIPITFNGGAGDDTITGGVGADRFVLSPGNDQINADATDTAELEFDGDSTAGATTVSWSAGTSTFNGTPELLLLRGGAGDNTIDASAYPGAVQIEGGDGADTLRGGAATTFIGGAGADSFYPAAGMSTISDASAADGDRLFAPESSVASMTDTALTWTPFVGPAPQSSVTFNGLFAEVQLLGTAQDDALDASGYSGRVVIDGRDGNDTLTGSQGGGVLDGGAGDDTITGGAGSDTFMPGAGANSVTDATASDDDVLAYTGSGDMTLGATSLATADGSTTFSSLVENALLTGDDGPNVIDATSFGGSVTLRGLGGNDTLTDSANDDVVVGGDGDDTMFVGLGNDTVDAGNGDDRVEQPALTMSTNALQQATTDDDTFDGGAGIDTLVQRADGTQTLSDTQLTGQGTDTISNFEQAELTGGAGDDIIDALRFSGNVVLRGLGGNDTLIGSQGDSVIEGGEGDDVITSGAGQNSIDGGPGIDTIDGVVEGTTVTPTDPTPPPTDPTPPPTDPTVKLYIPLLSKDR